VSGRRGEKFGNLIEIFLTQSINQANSKRNIIKWNFFYIYTLDAASLRVTLSKELCPEKKDFCELFLRQRLDIIQYWYCINFCSGTESFSTNTVTQTI
jgi:hypothetical protein